MYYQQEIETLPLAQLRALQDERLRALTQYLYHRVPFYREQWDAAGVRPDQIKGVRDLPLLPFTRKTDLRDQYPFGLFATPMDEVSRIHCSSGTTGKPTVVGYTQGDLDIFTEVVARSLVAAGARPGMKLQNAYGYGLFTGGLGMHYGAEKLGMAVVPVSGGMTARQLMLLQDFAPEVICCTPSYAQTLAEELAKQGISHESLAVKYAILGAEPWTETIRSEVEQGLGVQATNIYGLSEIIGPGVSQEAVEERGTGSYIWEDHFFPEVVDRDTGEPLPEGQSGVLVFTTLTKRAMPLMRYWTNDITHLHYDQQGSRTHIKMGPIQGRADDMLIIRGVNFFHTQVEDVLQGREGLLAHYQVQVSRPHNLDEVQLKVEVAQSWLQAHDFSLTDDGATPAIQNLKGSLEKSIKDTIGLNIPVELVIEGSIPRSAGGKLSRVVDLRP